MPSRRSRTTMYLGALALGGSLLTGCANKNAENHSAWADQAAVRYKELRTGLMLDMAQQQFDGGDLDMADKTTREAMGADPDNPRIYVLAGRIALERGQLERSFHLFSQAIELNERLPEPRYYQGVVLQRWQQYDRAEERYREAYELEPDNISYLLAQTEMMVAGGRLDSALVHLKDKLQYFDQSSALRAAIGHLLNMQGKPVEAVFYFEQASLLQPDNVKLEEELALTRLAAKQYNRAIPALETLLQRREMADRTELRRSLATAYLAVGRTDKAREIYLSLARSSQPAANDWLKLGEMSLQSGDLFGALQAANQAITIEPQRPEGYLLAGLVWQRREKMDEALRMFDRAAELAPHDATPMILRGISLERTGRRTAAAEAYEEALRRQPDHTRAQQLLAKLQPNP